ncbi:glycosyltransferase family 2 protein [Candidatus Poribacteria bacterium]|nr:glycosyltransferase family 2 protein [Candidatus Poribacteria bacterium]
MNNETPEFSVLVTCYCEEKSIEEFHSRVSATMESLGRSYEIIMVSDGSADGTFEKLKGIFLRDPKVSAVLDLFKNAGQQAAFTAAVCQARGRAFLYMDSDLQLPPEELPLLVREYDKGYDIVSGYRKNRKDSLLRIIPSYIANMIMRKASRSSFRDFGCSFKLFNAELIRAFEFGPFHIFSSVDVISRAQRCHEIPVTHFPRKYGKSGWTFRKLWTYNMENIVSMSERPFQLLALASLFLAFLFAARVVVDYFSPFRILPGVSNGLLLNAVVISSFVLIGILCMVGEFTLRSFVSSRHVPKYIVREILRR